MGHPAPPALTAIRQCRTIAMYTFIETKLFSRLIVDYMTDDDYAALSRRAAEAGVSVPELLRREIVRLAARPTMEEWLSRTRRRSSPVTRAEVLDALDEERGPWPDAGR